MKVARLHDLKHFYKPAQFIYIEVEINRTAPFRPRVPAGHSARTWLRHVASSCSVAELVVALGGDVKCQERGLNIYFSLMTHYSSS